MHVRRGDIVIVELDPTRGSEQRGTRPCLVVQNDIGNENAPTTIVVPFTTSFGEQLYPFEVAVLADECALQAETVKVPDSTADKWDEYVEDTPEVDSVSHLIRLSVKNQIDGRTEIDRQQAPDSTDGAFSGEVLTTLQGIQTGIDDLEDRLTALEEVESAEASYDLQKAIYEILPADSELPHPIGVVDEIPKPEDPDELDVMTPQEVAQKLGANMGEVEDTLKELAETTGQVQRSDTNHDGNHYWKRGDK
nr:type II toxin-antitoxin system PemK/MazF family toxin [Halostagnicola sp. A56]